MLPKSNVVFISYSHKDRRWLDRLMVHLEPLKRAGIIELWVDTEIRSGEDWSANIASAIETARVAVLLVSADFLASDFIVKNELPPLLQSAKEKKLIVIPIIVSPCLYEQTQALASIQSVNPPSKALSRLRKYDSEEYLVKLAIQIEGVLSVGKHKSDIAVPIFQDPGGGYVRSLAESQNKIESDNIGVDIPILGDPENQWVLIIGTKPSWLVSSLIPTEILDAGDVLALFSDPGVYGSFSSERLYFLAGEHATVENVSWALRDISEKIQPQDSLLFYFSGHSSEWNDPGELVFYDAPIINTTHPDEAQILSGVLQTKSLVDWCNLLNARKVVCILDSGGPSFYKSSGMLHNGRYIISALNGRFVGRNGILTWYVHRILEKFGRSTTVAQLYEILKQADELLDPPLSVYLRGRDPI